ncbi:MAG: hypothetical protein ACP5HZ_01230 [Ferrimicrobium sp.]
MTLSEPVTQEEFGRISAAFLDGLTMAMPAYFARVEAELVREGEVDLDWLTELQRQVESELALLLGAPAETQREPPVGLIRRRIMQGLAENGCAASTPALQRRGLLPASAVDIDSDLSALHLAWGVAKARRLRALTEEPTRG